MGTHEMVRWQDMTPVQRVRAHLTHTGLSLPEGIPFEDWLSLGPIFRRLASEVKWALGDWINYGERHYGEKYAQAEAETDYDNGYLRNVAWVARTIKTSLRYDTVPFSYYQSLASSHLTDNDRYELLSQVVTGKTEAGSPILITRADLQELIRVRLERRGIRFEKPTPLLGNGLAKDAPDDGLPIPANGKVEAEREHTQQEKETVDELEALRRDAAMYQKVKPYLQRIEACIEEDILKWLSDTAATLEEEKAFYAEQNT